MAVQITRGYRDRLLNDVRTAAGDRHTPRDRYFSHDLWDRWAAGNGRPDSGKMRYWFGSWTNVTDEAGLPGPEHYPLPGVRRREADRPHDDAAPSGRARTLAEELFRSDG